MKEGKRKEKRNDEEVKLLLFSTMMEKKGKRKEKKLENYTHPGNIY